MDKQDVIKTAVQLEKDGRAFYLAAASKTANEAVRRVFTSLAADEENHIAWIEKNLGVAESAKELNRQTYDRVKHIFNRDAQVEARASSTDIEPLRRAVTMEQESYRAYGDWADEVADPALSDILKKLVDVEKFHEELLQNTILYLEDPAQFFQNEEGWMLDGG
jgi:rubrerythrin